MPKASATNRHTTRPNDIPEITASLVTRRRLLGVLVCLYAAVMLLALITYDWHDISWLCNPPSPPNGHPANRIGLLGAWMTFYGYAFAGLAYHWLAFPFLVLFAGGLLHGRVRSFRLRSVWLFCLYLTAACLFQAYESGVGATLAELNIRDAGGAIGKWLVTNRLDGWLGDIGLQLFLWPLAIFFAFLVVGVRNCLLLVVRLATAREPREEVDEAESESESREEPEPRKETRTVPPPPSPEPVASEPPKASSESLFSKVFKRRETDEAAAASAPEPTDGGIRNLLAHRTAPRSAPQNDWAAHTPAPAPEPLFEQPSPAPEPEPLTLDPDPPGRLKPVSPEKAVTAPAPAVNDNDEEPAPDFAPYALPPIDLLDPIPPRKGDADDIPAATAAMESVFQQFGIDAHVVNHIRGPVLTQFEIQPGPKVKLEKFRAYERNLLLALRATSIRIQAPILGRDVVGIEVPNTVRQSVTLREILEGDVWRRAEAKMALPLAIGKLATGGDLVVDLAECPHLLVAGGTGSGKSVTVNDMLVGLLMCRKPDQLRLLMVDPKRVEFTAYDDLPHLLNPVVVEPKKVLFSLRWAVVEMNRRYKLLQRYGVRNIADLNRRVDKPLPGRDNPTAKLPYIVIVVDELAELMLTVKADIEPPITSLTQKARAAGIHLIIATQRPTTDIITGTIKANIPARLALRVSQSNDSRTILDHVGAEKLIGKGDMLFSFGGENIVRAQSAWLSDDEINRICDFIKEQSGPAFDNLLAGNMERIKEDKPADDVHSLISEFVTPEPVDDSAVDLGAIDDTSDEGLYQKALEYIRQTGRFSTSALQRRLKIGYNKAGRITDMLEERGIIGAGGKAGGSREILVDLNEMTRQQFAGTDGEAAAFDTRTNPSPQEAPDALAPEPSAPELDPSGPAPEDDFDLGDLDPASLDMPDIIHPPTHEDPNGTR